MIAKSYSSSPLRDFFEELYLVFRLVQPTTCDDYRIQIGHLESYYRSLGGEDPLTLAHLTDEFVAGAIGWQVRRGRSAATANKLGRTAAALWRLAKRRHLVTTAPDIDRLPEMKREPECWSIEEMTRILEEAAAMPGQVGPVPAGVWWPAIIWTAFNTGCRITALMHVPTAKVEMEAGWIRVPCEVQKDKEDMSFDLLAPTIEALGALDAHGRGLVRIFDDWPYDRRQRQWKALNRRLRQILDAAGLSRSRRDLWHKVRRTFGTYVAARGGEATAQQLLGHSSVETTRRYLDLRKIERPSVASLLPAPSIRSRTLKLYRPAAL